MTRSDVRSAPWWLPLLVFLLVAFAAGGIGSLVQGADVGARYLAFERPGWAPPSETFGIVWPVLYACIGVAGWRFWRSERSARRSTALAAWVAQLLLNAAWPGVFFGASELGWAMPVIVLLDIVVVGTIVVGRRVDRVGAWLLLPYLAWLLYATALNVALWRLN